MEAARKLQESQQYIMRLLNQQKEKAEADRAKEEAKVQDEQKRIADERRKIEEQAALTKAEEERAARERENKEREKQQQLLKREKEEEEELLKEAMTVGMNEQQKEGDAKTPAATPNPPGYAALFRSQRDLPIAVSDAPIQRPGLMQNNPSS